MAHTSIFHLPHTVLIDEIVPVELTHAFPHHPITIRAQMTDRFGQCWESHASFLADAEGTISTATHAPLAGTYDECDPTGLFWSMQPLAKKDADPTKDPLSPLVVHFTAENDAGETLATTTLTRLFIAPDVSRTMIRENGLDGAWFTPAGKGPFPAVLVVGGSEGGLNLRYGAMLASQGFAVLSLAYFGREGLPKYLINIPLEYIKKGIDWVRAQPNIRPDQLTMIGWSKGGELALLTASTFPEITAVVAYVPSAYVNSGLGPKQPGVPHSSWSYQGEPLPYANADVPAEITARLEEGRKSGTPLIYRDWYLATLGNQMEREPYTIPVERINGPICLLTVGDDQLWNCEYYGDMILQRLQEHQHPFANEHFFAPHAGHSLSVVGMPTTTVGQIPYGSTTLLLGGTPQATAQAQSAGWKQVVSFLRRHT